MNDALRMDLADCGSPTTLVGAILKHHPNMPRPVPVEEIALLIPPVNALTSVCPMRLDENIPDSLTSIVS